MSYLRLLVVRDMALALAYGAVIVGTRVLVQAGPNRAIGAPVAFAFALLLILGARAIPALVLGALAFGPVLEEGPALFVIVAVYVPVVWGGTTLIRHFARGQEWFIGESATVSILTGSLLTPLLTGGFSLLLIRQFGAQFRSDYSSNDAIFLGLQWTRECAATLTLVPFVLVHVRPYILRWMKPEHPPVRWIQLSRAEWGEVALQALWAPALLGFTVWMKTTFGLSVTSFALLPLLASARNGIAVSSAALAASTLTCTVVWVHSGWINTLDVAGFRTLLVSTAIPVIVLAALAEQRVQAFRQADQLEREFGALAAHAEVIRDDERTRICSTIAGDLRPGLIRLRTQVAVAADARARDDDSGYRSCLAASARAVDALIQTVRRIATELRPGILDSLGLDAGVEWLTRDFQARYRIPCKLECLDAVAVKPRVKTVFFRLLQDVLSRIGSDGRGSDRAVSVALESAGAEACLRIHIEGGAATNPVELLALRERVASVGGDLTAVHLADGTLTGLVAKANCGHS